MKPPDKSEGHVCGVASDSEQALDLLKSALKEPLIPAVVKFRLRHCAFWALSRFSHTRDEDYLLVFASAVEALRVWVRLHPEGGKP